MFSVSHLTSCTCNARRRTIDKGGGGGRGGLSATASKTASLLFLHVPCMDNSVHPTLPFNLRIMPHAPKLAQRYNNWCIAFFFYLRKRSVSHSCHVYPFLQFIKRQSTVPCARRESWRAAAPIDKNPRLRDRAAFNVTKTCMRFYRAVCSRSWANCCTNTPQGHNRTWWLVATGVVFMKTVPAFCLM